MTTSHIAFITIVALLAKKNKINLQISIILEPTYYSNDFVAIMKTFFFLGKSYSAHYPGVEHEK